MYVSPFRPVSLRLSLSAVAALADATARALHRPRLCGDHMALAFAFQLGPCKSPSVAPPQLPTGGEDFEITEITV